jgi:hypothetical protein
MKLLDKLRLRGESTWLEGRIVSESVARQTVFDSGTEHRIDHWRIAELVFGERDADLEEGRAWLVAGRPGLARNCFERVTGRRGWIAAHARFGIVASLRLDARLSGQFHMWEAVSMAAQDFWDHHQNHRFCPEVHFFSAESALAMGDLRGARASFRSPMGGYGPAWELLGRYGEGLVQLAAGRLRTARATFEKVIQEGTTREDGYGCEAARLALVGKARVLRAAGDVEDAARELTAALDDEDFAAAAPTAALAANEAGECFLALGESAVHAAAALPFFLRTIRQEPYDHAEYARALGMGVRCMNALDTATAKEGAAILAEALRTRYPTSKYAPEARDARGGGA